MASIDAATSNSAAVSNRNRQHTPPVELPSSTAQNFFEEAGAGQAEENELKRKFLKFCTKAPGVNGDDKAFLTFDDFCRFLQHYEAVQPATSYEAYFYAMDRDRDDKLSFSEFYLGCCAADPQTVHILNSFTGKERAQFIFDFYDMNRTSLLEFEEFERIVKDCSPSTPAEPQAQKSLAIEKADELGLLKDGATFTPPNSAKFYHFIQNEKLRGTSRLFRFSKTVIKLGRSQRRNQGSSLGGSSVASSAAHHDRGSGAFNLRHQAIGPDDAMTEEPTSDLEDCEWHAHLLDIDNFFDPNGDEPHRRTTGSAMQEAVDAPYTALLPPAPASDIRVEVDVSTEAAKSVARKVLQSVSSSRFEGLAPAASSGLDSPLTLVSAAQLRALCQAAVRCLEPEDMVITGFQPPVKVFGSLHGQILDLLSHFKWQLPPVEDGDILYTTYVFLGDYADRGGHGLEVLTLLLSLKVINPHKVILLRGQHENRHLNYYLGLRNECERRFGAANGAEVYEHLNRVFEHMSLAAVIGNQILAFGPGILPASLSRLDQLRKYKKPLVIPHAQQLRPSADRLQDQILVELFTPAELLPLEFGAVREVSPETVKTFCVQHRLAAIVSSRQVPSQGFAFGCGGRLITICSCLNYCDLPGGNNASILCLTKEEKSSNLQVRPKVITAQVAKVYEVLGRPSPIWPPARRWPTQFRAPTPGRRLKSGDGEGSNGNEPTRLVILQDKCVVADAQEPLLLFPAFGPGRHPGGSRERGASHRRLSREGVASRQIQGSSIGLGMSSMLGSAVSPVLPRGSSGTTTAAIEVSVGSAANRRGAVSPSVDPTRYAPTSPMGTSAPSAGLSRPSAARQSTNGSGKSKEASNRGPSRPPGSSASLASPKALVPSAAITRTASGASAGGRSAAMAVGGLQGRSTQGPTIATNDAIADAALRTDLQPVAMSDFEVLRNVLQDSPGLLASAVPSSPSLVMQAYRRGEPPTLVVHLCRSWLEAGLGDRDWQQALQIYDQQLRNQPKISKANLSGASDQDDLREGRWTLETFSIWLMNQGRRLRECAHWFRAFDFDQDDMVGVADFLQGIAACTISAGSRSQMVGFGPSNLLPAMAVYRLLNLDKERLKDENDLLNRLEGVMADVQALQGSDLLTLPTSQLVQRASDFEMFRITMLPALQFAQALRLNVFGI